MSLTLTVALAGCATYEPVPEGFTGSTAYLRDGTSQQDGSTGSIFAAVAIDGQRIENAFAATQRASSGRGFSLAMGRGERRVPVRAMKVTLRGSIVTAAPIQAMALQVAGQYHSVEGVVDFRPQADTRYEVKGELKKGASSVWIEDAATGLPASEKVVGR
jgi:hypothetical protein